MKRITCLFLSASIISGAALADDPVVSQIQEISVVDSIPAPADSVVLDSIYMMPDSAFLAPRPLEDLYEYLDTVDMSQYDSHWRFLALPRYSFGPAVYQDFIYADTTTFETPLFSGAPEMRWIEEENALAKRLERMQQYLFFSHPEVVRYNVNLLPEAPKRYHAVVDPQKHTIAIEESKPVKPETTIAAAEVQKKHWMKVFNASLHFSQAYVSPNWYQGGNNNLNMLGNIYYNVKLNPKYHPNLLFETTAQYKLGFNSTPDDKVRDFNISDDLFQVNTTLGIKAIRKWYYSFTGQFKTQLFNSYPANSRDIRSSFMSPGDLTAGIGMTYNTTNKPKTITFDASVAPLSYSLRTCINDRIDPTRYNVEKDHKTKSKFGSSADLKLSWKIYYNISLSSHFFTFTDYESLQADWENTVNFDVNRYLSTQIYVHARFDTKTPKVQDSSWKKLQIKEILSFGLTYKFSSI